MNIKTIHPFPARMAPEIALNALKELRNNVVILDPMMGSGTTLKVGSYYGHRCYGFDMDPLAVLISKVWNTSLDIEELENVGKRLVEEAMELKVVDLPWIDEDIETSNFINFWFAEPQKSDLRKLSYLLSDQQGDITDVLKVALSRLIITKDKGASLGRDISHSRPHKVRSTNEFNVIENFQKSVKHLTLCLKQQRFNGQVKVNKGDARNLNLIHSESIDFIITSPPYLHAVDYLRGHKLSLVWLGYKISELRNIRRGTIGVEKKPENDHLKNTILKLIRDIGSLENLTEKKQLFIHRYAIDLFSLCKEFYRVLKTEGKAIVVIADSYVSQNLIKNTQIFKNAAELAGLKLLDEHERQILATRRYLPPPNQKMKNDLANRMKTEAVITFCKPK